MNETAVPVISFKEAYREMLKGSKVAHVDLKGGYWAWEKGTIMIHCHDGKVLDIRETDDVSFTFGFITDDRWYVKEGGLMLDDQQEDQRDYEACVEMAEYCERYEQTYNPEDGSM